MRGDIKISAIVPVCNRHDPTGKVIEEYEQALSAAVESFELIVVFDGEHQELCDNVKRLAQANNSIRIIQLGKSFGEATALTVGFEHARNNILLTMPAYYQIDPSAIGLMIDSLEGADMVIAVRWPRKASSKFEVVRRKLFHWLVQVVGRVKYQDLGCNARAIKRDVVDEIPIYGDQHRFLPLLAERRGFRVLEVEVAQSHSDYFSGSYGPRVYLRRLLDIITVFFLVRFTKKPLRFFGTLGSLVFLIGTIVLIYVVIERLLFGIALADRPALLLSSLFVVLGIQLFGLGLLGELIIYSHAKELREYTIEKIVN